MDVSRNFYNFYKFLFCILVPIMKVKPGWVGEIRIFRLAIKVVGFFIWLQRLSPQMWALEFFHEISVVIKLSHWATSVRPDFVKINTLVLLCKQFIYGFFIISPFGLFALYSSTFNLGGWFVVPDWHLHFVDRLILIGHWELFRACIFVPRGALLIGIIIDNFYRSMYVRLDALQPIFVSFPISQLDVIIITLWVISRLIKRRGVRVILFSQILGGRILFFAGFPHFGRVKLLLNLVEGLNQVVDFDIIILVKGPLKVLNSGGLLLIVLK